MSDARETRRRKIFDALKLACKIAAKRTAGGVVLVNRPIDEGMAISCRTKSRGTIEFRLYVRSDCTIFLVDESGEETIVGVLDDDGVPDKIAHAIYRNGRRSARTRIINPRQGIACGIAN
jgi:hypothetical protein